MNLYTLQISQTNNAKAQGITILDTTIKSGDTRFSPTWSMVNMFKAKELSEHDYTQMFYDHMRTSYSIHRQRWLDICNTPKLGLSCYCTADTFCHRLLLVDIFRSICQTHNIPFTYEGEITSQGLIFPSVIPKA